MDLKTQRLKSALRIAEEKDFTGYGFLYPPLAIWKKIQPRVKKNKLRQIWLDSLARHPRVGLYVHIPFCKTKCHFCRFFSVEASKKEISSYLHSLKKEISLYKHIFRNTRFRTLYLGGGTPTLLSYNELQYLLEEVFSNFEFTSDFQFTLESSPNFLNLQKLKLLKQYHLNRLTIGIQTLDKTLLEKTNRTQNCRRFFFLFKQARSMGIQFINVDLMFGLPSQSLKSFRDDLKKITKLRPDMIHVNKFLQTSFVKFFNLSQRGSSAKIKKMSDFTHRWLASQGYAVLEFDSWALHKKANNRQLTEAVRDYASYLGIGPAAVSRASGKLHYVNHNDINIYHRDLEQNILPLAFGYPLSKEEAMRDYVLNSLRYGTVSNEKFSEIFGAASTKAIGIPIGALRSKIAMRQNINLSYLPKRYESNVFLDRYAEIFFSRKVIRKLLMLKTLPPCS